MDSLPPRAWRNADAATTGPQPTTRALVLSGGVALGAFEAGAYAALEEAGVPLPDWFIGASIGAVNAAIIAGNPPGRRVERLRSFWASAARDPAPATTLLLGPPPEAGAWRRAHNQASAFQTLLFGVPGLFRPKLATLGAGSGAGPGLYDLQPLRDRLPDFVDFDRLNGGGVRFTLAATDVASGERVVFDTACGARVGPEHVAASGALMPLIAPVEVEGRLLCDGGLSANTPLDLALDDPGSGDLLCFVVELFAMENGPPRSLGASLSRAMDIAFGNQTRRIMEGREREHRLRSLIDRLAERLPQDVRDDPEVASLLAEAEDRSPRSATVLRVTHRASADEAHPGGVFDVSPATLADRWEAGARGMREALRQIGGPSAPAATPPAPGLAVGDA
ncbi:MAG: patatin-like phospholipase family protein [Acetobacteraceae bacterium]|nr:patatin-like phospholipase family protein [Acetobacteraceae bacterium]